MITFFFFFLVLRPRSLNKSHCFLRQGVKVVAAMDYQVGSVWDLFKASEKKMSNQTTKRAMHLMHGEASTVIVNQLIKHLNFTEKVYVQLWIKGKSNEKANQLGRI